MDNMIVNYDLQIYPSNYFDYFVDIGGCRGDVSLTMANMHPNTKIICYEPSNEDYYFIKKRVSTYPNIVVVNEALGNGNNLYFNRVKIGQHLFTDKGEYHKPSHTLYDILNIHGIKDRYALKIDCEGGERFLIGDKDSENSIRNSEHMAMEIHFAHEGKYHQWFNQFPAWNVYNDWIHREFSSTHHIKYWKSRRDKGVGIYVITKQK